MFLKLLQNIKEYAATENGPLVLGLIVSGSLFIGIWILLCNSRKKDPEAFDEEYRQMRDTLWPWMR